MQLTGQTVKHGLFGQGVVTKLEGNMVTVSFPDQGEKKFMYPDAFGHFLTLGDQNAERKLQDILDEKKQQEHAQTLAVLEEQERLERLTNYKITANSQAVFDLGHLEEDALEQWCVSTGAYLSGCAKGMPRIPDRLKPNSACVLTRRSEGEPEEARKVVGIFMVPDDFFGEECSDGVIHAHKTYRLRLDEALPFWPYLDDAGQKPRWGNVSFKYFSNKSMEKLLRDLRDRSAGTKDAAVTEQFYQYFCRVNQLPARSAAPRN